MVLLRNLLLLGIGRVLIGVVVRFMRKDQLIQRHLMSRDVFLDFFYLFLTKKALFFIALNNFVSCLLMDSVNFHEQPFNFQAVILQLVHIVLMIEAQFINLFFVFILLLDNVCLLLLYSLL